MKTQHTPGPWKYDREYDTIRSADADLQNVLIAKIATGHDSREENANGHLIETAPELLEASKAVCEAIRQVISLANLNEETRRILLKAGSHLNEVVAKAKNQR